jgi:hypothetical protein
MKNLYYKYRPLYMEGCAGVRVVHPFTESIFTKAEVYFAAPADFNDPFDCHLRAHVNDSTDAEWEAYLDEMMVKDPASKANLLQVKNDEKLRKKLAADVGKEQQRIHYSESSVLCLAKKGNSIPMFSYYADGHRGIAIELSFSDEEVPYGFNYHSTGTNGKPYDGKVIFRDVEYPTVFPELNYHRLRKTDRLVRHLLFTKAAEWSHEEEFRIFRRKVAKGAVSFDRKLLTKVVFGCNTERTDVDLVRSWLNGWPSDVIFCKAEPATDKFELLVKDFDVVKGVRTV